jgi:electron transport complex protein RnfB
MNTEDEVYRDLQRHLNRSAVGFPETKSGVEISLLKHLFTPEEAKIATHLSTMKLEPAKHIYRRVKGSGMSLSLEELQKKLDRMVYKGTLLAYQEGFKERHYKNTGATAGGMMDFQVNRQTPELLEDFDKYHAESFGEAETTGTVRIPQLRTIPVARSIPTPAKFKVSVYDDVRKLVENSTGPFAVANCMCRQDKDLQGKSCKYSDIRETCLQIGPDHARQYVEMGIGRLITREEALEVLNKAEQAGFILQPENSKHPEAICCCCGDCCGLLSRVVKSPRPADLYASNYYVEVDPKLCQGCGTCVKRCQLEARTIVNGVAVVNLDRCIGCGNCVVTCETKASQLRKKDKEMVPFKSKDAMFWAIMSRKLGRWYAFKAKIKTLCGLQV